MIPVTIYSGKNVALFGLGGSGMVTAHALLAGGADVTAFDDNRESVAKADAEGIPTADLRECDFSQFDSLLLAPGVPLTHPRPHWSVELARSAGVEIIGDIELFCRQRAHENKKTVLIAITGTNGKSTSTALIAHILEDAGRKVEMGGNIGRAVLDFDPIEDGTIFVVEVSSYQIDLAPGIDPDIGVHLNLSPDHLDRHGDMDHYAEIKERLVAGSDYAIVGIDDSYSKAIADRLEQAGNNLSLVSVQERVEDGMFTNETRLVLNENGTEEVVADVAGIGSLRGRHNAQNACVAWLACHRCGLTGGEMQSGFTSFPGLVDRMEELGKFGKILVVNDSKGTNADATDMALGSFERIYWIAGGLAKEGGIESLRKHFGKIAKAYLIGEAAANFAGTLGEEVEFEISGSLDMAFKHALEEAGEDDHGEPVILMSPACASFDQFSSYAARGEYFRKLVRETAGFEPRGHS